MTAAWRRVRMLRFSRPPSARRRSSRAAPSWTACLELARPPEGDGRLLERLAALRKQGFRVVLDDFSYDAALEPLLAQADMVKLDVVRLGQHEALGELERLRGRKVEALAEGIDSEDVFEVYRDPACRSSYSDAVRWADALL